MNADDLDLIVYSALASYGFITVLPDYIGFGSSSHIFHPYYAEDLAATSVVDMLKAARELANNNQVTFNQKLFLGGYSQGGYVTMATHKYLEANELEGFDLLASFPAAGGYDIKGFQELLFTMDSYPHPYYIGYIALSYKITFNRNEPLTDIFNEPYASAMPSLFDGSNPGSAIDAALTDDLAMLMNPDFRDSLDTSPRFAYFRDALEANSLTDWAPTIKMFMYHGDSDTTVPHQNSGDTYNTLITNGASTEVLQFITLPGANHSDGVQPYLEDVIPKMLAIYETPL